MGVSKFKGTKALLRKAVFVVQHGKRKCEKQESGIGKEHMLREEMGWKERPGEGTGTREIRTSRNEDPPSYRAESFTMHVRRGKGVATCRNYDASLDGLARLEKYLNTCMHTSATFKCKPACLSE